MRYACPSCGRWVRPLVEVTAVVCLRCGVYARREDEDQPTLLEAAAPAKSAEEQNRTLREDTQ